MPEPPSRDPSLLSLLVWQRECWRRGERVGVEEVLARHPAAKPDADALLDLIYNEVVLREEAGEAPRLDEYVARFPALAEALRLQFEVDDALGPEATQEPPPPVATDSTLPVAPPSPDPAAWLKVPGCDVLNELGRGAMGVVYRAWQRGPNRIVALKVLLGGVPPERVRTEAEAAARLQHPHIVQVFEVKEHAGRTCLVLEYVEGGNLSKKIAGRPQPPREAARLVQTLALAIEHAHQKGVIHRDLKPSNVLLASGGRQPPVGGDTGGSHLPLADCIPKISDFGLAKLTAGGSASLTGTTDVLGTPSYMAPEQAGGGQAVGPPADVYSLGAILYELLTGRPPFLGENVLDTLAQVKTQDPVAPRRLQPKVPRYLETITLKCLEKSPGRRYGSAAELADDLSRFLDGRTIRARPAGALERAAKWARRKPAAAALVAVVVAAALALAGGGVFFTQQVRQQRDLARKRAEELDVQLDRTRRLLFTAQLLRVGTVWRSDPLQGLQMLEDPVACPPDLRDFAWGVLYGECKRYRAVLRGHDKRVTAVAFQPGEGGLLASASHDGSVRLWGPGGEGRGVLRGHAHRVTALAFSPDGQTLASASYDGTVKLWDLSERAARATLACPGGRVAGVAFSPDGRTLAANSGDPGTPGVVTLWDVRTRKRRRTLEGATRSGCGVAFHPGGDLVACAAPDHTVLLWDVRTGQPGATLLGHEGAVRCVAFSPDGQTLASGGADGKVHLWDLATKGHKALDWGHGPVAALAFSPDGEALAAAAENPPDLFSAEGPRVVQLWHLPEGRPGEVLRGHSGSVMAVAFGARGRSLATGGNDATVKLWDVAGRRERVPLPGHDGRPGSVALSRDGQTLAWADRGLQVVVWDVAGERQRSLLTGHERPVRCVALSEDGHTLASAGGGADEPAEVRLWDVTSARTLHTLRGHVAAVQALALSPDGRTLASGGWGGAVRLWDVATGRVRAQLKGHQETVAALAFSADGKLLASGGGPPGGRGELKLWDVATGRPALDVEGVDSPVTCLAFRPDGRRLAAGCRDGVVRVWELPSGEARLALRPAVKEVASVAFSPDGQTLAVGGAAQAVKLWDTRLGQERAALPGHAQGVCYVAFTGDGTTLAAASGAQALRLWHSVAPK